MISDYDKMTILFWVTCSVIGVLLAKISNLGGKEDRQ